MWRNKIEADPPVLEAEILEEEHPLVVSDSDELDTIEEGNMPKKTDFFGIFMSVMGIAIVIGLIAIAVMLFEKLGPIVFGIAGVALFIWLLAGSGSSSNEIDIDMQSAARTRSGGGGGGGGCQTRGNTINIHGDMNINCDQRQDNAQYHTEPESHIGIIVFLMIVICVMAWFAIDVFTTPAP